MEDHGRQLDWWNRRDSFFDDHAKHVALSSERVEQEVRIVDPITGGAKGQKPEDFASLPPDALMALARHFGAGAAKYSRHNYRRGFAYSLSFSAMQRHAWKFWGGEELDAETQTHHLAAVAFHALALLQMQADGVGTDDRYTP